MSFEAVPKINIQRHHWSVKGVQEPENLDFARNFSPRALAFRTRYDHFSLDLGTLE